jgi:hypothetical protein
MFAWAGSVTQPGGLYRIRATGQPIYVPLGLKARRGAMEITFSGPLDGASAAMSRSFTVRTWSLRRTENYGSDHYDERTLMVAATRLLEDRRTVRIELPELQPTWCMSIDYTLRAVDGEPVYGSIHNTIHQLVP